MHKILRVLFVISISISLHALGIDERKTDLYYANGIMMNKDADEAEADWRIRVDDLFANHPGIKPYTGEVAVSYNIKVLCVPTETVGTRKTWNTRCSR